MKQLTRRRIAAALLTGILLTACGTDRSDSTADSMHTLDSTDSAERTETTSAANTDQTTTTAEQTTTNTETTSTAAAASTEAFDVRTLFANGREAALSCSGLVFHSPEGLGLFAEPDDTAELRATLQNRTDVEVLGMRAAGSLHNRADRWLHVRADGQEGYVHAANVAVQCSTPLSKLNEAERGTLGVLMYYQSLELFLRFQREGGTISDGTTGEDDGVGFDRLAPDGITFAQLMDAFHEYFVEDYDDRFAECYREDDNALWVITGYGDDVLLDYTELYTMTGQSDDRLTFEARVHWYTDIVETEEWTYDPFEIVYTDGVWKTAVMVPKY